MDSVKAVINSQSGLDYHYDPSAKKLILRPTLFPWTGTGLLPILEGREVTIMVSG